MHFRTLLLSFLLFMAAAVSAQERRVQNKPFIDERKFHYGFFVGLHDQGFQLATNGYINPETGEQWMASTDRFNYGFTVGVLGEWKLNNYLGLRLLPTLHFGSKHIKYLELSTGNQESQDMKSCYVGLPIDLKVAGPRFNNYRPYIIAGLAPMYDLSTGKGTNLRAKPFTLMLEVGMGCDMYLPFFKLIPELKFCFGLNNVLDTKRSDLTDSSQMIYTQSIDKATVTMMVLTFYFE